jgi:hypothetical protein
MANVLFDKAREAFLSGLPSISWSSDTIRAVLVDHGVYTPDVATDQFLSDIPEGARVATSGEFAAKTVTAGVADADDIVFSGTSGATVHSLVIYKDTGHPSTSPLIASIDTIGAGAFPITPNGVDVHITWDDGKIFKL